jgi:hypothetical protein
VWLALVESVARLPTELLSFFAKIVCVWQRGSMVERACQWLIQQRCKGEGMSWSEDGCIHLCHLKLAWDNGSFEALFQVRLQLSSNT